ncbi:hypothetical protein GCM10010112_81910 [Actinoplanes lobatus]|uniref:Putative extracellular nuclease n=1 Tax=Actinoplanes lobatus TaxID=113568 RepID=A0A7W7HL78_9ACTN|nr:lamin tail domain-containing protein [Actinoplanes lobatus]MBB4752603.1 putative extracellular nuclease [Actinoplanes lobatus]GGN93545.1 hypothetical protein GCM10010112_81910 [Actinoplanes lobatus]GIE44729.1 hypothetical protein Alo02nite_76270 [Actinoplanes lobatus]
MSSPSDAAPATRQPWRWIAVGVTTVAVTAAGITYASASTTAAVPNVRFTKVYYNSPGSDTRTNASLNAEYVQVTNKTSKSVDLAGWTIRDKSNHVHTLAGTLAAGKALTVHTGKGTNGKPAGHRYWQSGNYVWNNTGDTATLRTKTGATAHTCTWGKTGSVTSCPGGGPATVPPTTRPTTITPTKTLVPTTAPTTKPTTEPTTEPTVGPG